MVRSSSMKGVLVCLFATLASGAAYAQQYPYNIDTKPPRGVAPTSEQQIGALDSIDPVTGRLHIRIPLASLPEGNAGHGFDLGLVYNSNLFDLAPDEDTTDGNYVTRELRSAVSNGGWSYNFQNYFIDQEVRFIPSWEALECSSTNAELLSRQQRLYRYRISLPDGSQHTLHLLGYGDEPSDQSIGDGFYPFNMDGVRSPCAAQHPARYPTDLLNQTLTWYTTDGSYLRLQMQTDGDPGNASTQRWILLYPDGRQVLGSSYKADYVLDANGNTVAIANVFESGKAVTYIADEFNRRIRIESGYNTTPTTRVDRITAPGPNGPLEWRVKWKRIRAGSSTDRYVCFEDDTLTPAYTIRCTLNVLTWVVEYIQFPTAAPAFPAPADAPWTSFEFGYAEGTGNYGHLASMRVPTGALYTYYWVRGLSWHPHYTLFEADGIAYGGYDIREVTHDGITDRWVYGRSSSAAIAVNPDGGQTRYSFYDPLPASQAWMRGLVYRIEEPNGTVRKRQWSQNKVASLAGPLNIDPNNPFISRESVTTDALEGQPRSAVTDYSFDKNGNLLTVREYDWSNYSQSAAVEAPGALRRTTSLNYYLSVPAAADASNGPDRYWGADAPRRLDAVQRRTVSEESGVRSISEFEYDNPLSNGNVKVERRWDDSKPGCAPTVPLSPVYCLNLTRGYQPNGNLTDIFEPAIRTRLIYDSGPYPTRVEYGEPGTDAYRRFDYSWAVPEGVLLAKTDAQNSIATEFTYDTVGRLKTETEAGLRRTETSYDDQQHTVTVKRDRGNLGDGTLQTITRQDQLGRVDLVRTSEYGPLSPAGDDGIKVRTVYQSFTGGTRTVTSTPYRSTADSTLEWTCTERDQGSRVVAIATFKGASPPSDCRALENRTGIATTSHQAPGGTPRIRRTDPAGKIVDEYSDALGRITAVVEAAEGNGALGYVTSYAYDAQNNLTAVTQAGDGATQTRSFTYTSLGRLKSETHPENGRTDFTYEDSGAVSTRRDARGIDTTFTYDALQRLRNRSYSNNGGATPNVSFTYHDTAPHIGQLKSVASPEGTTTYDSYDALGRIASHTQSIPGAGSYLFRYTYWLNDALMSQQYPSGRVVAYDTDSAGRTTRVSLGVKTYADMTGLADAYSPDGRLLKMRLGNELWETREYPAPGNPTILRVGTAPGLGDKQQLEFTFFPTSNNGNLAGQVIVRPGSSPGTSRTWVQEYPLYDGVNRIKTACERAVNSPGSACGTGWIQHFGYDRYGNRWVEPTSAGLTGTDIHQPSATTNFDKSSNRLYVQNSAYDDAGNQVFFTPYLVAYDAEGRIRSMSSTSAGSGTFSYDGNGRRVKKVWTDGSTRITHYVYNAFGKLAAEYSSQPVTPGTMYVHTDILGSVRMITGDKPANWPNATADVLECYDYVPFGRMLNASDNGRNTGCYPTSPDYPYSSRVSQKFTGHERDPETRLDYFGVRYFSAAQGRFTSPDPAAFSARTILNPQLWNRYTYALNNPLKYIDPDGRDAIAAFFLGEQYRDVSTLRVIFGWETISDLKKTPAKFIGEHRALTYGLSPVPTSASEVGIQAAMPIVVSGPAPVGLPNASRRHFIGAGSCLLGLVNYRVAVE